MNVLVSQISPLALDAIHWKYYVAYAVLSTWPSPNLARKTSNLSETVVVVTFPAVWFWVKEPKGMSLESIDQLFMSEEPSADSINHVELGKQTRPRGFTVSSGGVPQPF
jgi:hypothetical protein